MKEAIRLTNKTAVALRRNAEKVRKAHLAAAAILTVVLAVLAVILGLRWLPAVPLMVIAIVLMDCAIMLHARSQYLLLVGQAICTEAAAQELKAGSSEKTRRARAISDLMTVKADVQRVENAASMKVASASPFFEEKKKAGRLDEDDDLNDQDDEYDPDDSDDLTGPLPIRKAKSETKLENKPETKTEKKLEAPQCEPASAHRRRRQSSLQLIKNEAK